MVIIANFNTIRAGLSFLYGLLLEKEIDIPIIKEEDQSFNVLLLGIGGGTHEGPELTDTIIFANINPKQNTVNLISIPRDFWMPDLVAKINTAYYFGQQKDDKGIKLSSASVEKILGEDIDYTVVIDFQGFVKMVDHLGGIDVDVEKSFTDEQYPVKGKEDDLCGQEEEGLEDLMATASSELDVFPCRYKTITFEKGETTMDGQTALEFVRSRHGTNGEGSDFARSNRQQKIIQAVRSKALSLGIVLNPVKVYGAYNIIKENLNTDIEEETYDDFIKLADKMQDAKIKSFVLSLPDEQQEKPGLLTNPLFSEQFSYQWVLIPRTGSGNYSEIHKYVDCIVQGKTCTVTDEGIEIEEMAQDAEKPISE